MMPIASAPQLNGSIRISVAAARRKASSGLTKSSKESKPPNRAWIKLSEPARVTVQAQSSSGSSSGSLPRIQSRARERMVPATPNPSKAMEITR